VRLLGAETEYAIRFRAAEGAVRPGNDVVYRAIRDAVERRVRASPARGMLDRLRQRIWWENGGSLYYEFGPEAPEGGLVEAGTPECRGPRELLVYQQAQDRLLTEATADALASLQELGIAGELSLLKNCRDARGRTYGAQENYEVDVATGASLLWWRLGLVLAVALAVCTSVFQWSVRALVVVGLTLVGCASFVVFLGAVLLGSVTQVVVERWSARLRRVFHALDRAESWFVQVSSAPLVAWVAGAVALFAFHRYRRPLVGFLATRAILTGAGTLSPDGSFGLSEKGPNIRGVQRWTTSPDDRGILEIGHLVKPLLAVGWFDFRAIPQLFRRRQRLQVGLSDANLCQLAEYLKVGTTSLVLDLAEAGRLADAPQLADPVGAVQVTGADPSMLAWVALENGGTMRVIDLQRFYWQRAADWLADTEAPPLEAHRIVELWGRTLDALEHHPESLFGQLDWVTKRELLSQAGDLSWEARKKIDLRYHELGTGYHRWLDDAGLCLRLVDEDEVRGACRHPPGSGPAAERSERVRAVAPELPEPAAPAEDGAAPPSRVIDFAAARARRSRGAEPPP
jgi:hypothetical protein